LAGSIACGVRWAWLWLLLTLSGAVAAAAAALHALVTGAQWEWRSRFALGGEPLHLRLDSLSAMFIVLLCAIGAAGAVYSRQYWDPAQRSSAPRGRAWWSALLLAMGLVLVVSNGLHFLIAWELFAVCGYFLITLERERRETRAAGWLYLAASHAGTLCLFAFFASLAARTGSWELGPMRDAAELAPLFWLALFGFGCKAGFFPLHVWLPAAHASAPSHVSAIMSGVAIKLGLYGILRFSGWLPVPAAAAETVIVFGAASAVLGIAFALAQNDLKRLLAYCSVENMGILMIGVGAALLGSAHGSAGWGVLALAGALLHVWNHGAIKAVLFLAAGSMLHATGTRQMSRLGGLWRTMPATTAVFALGAVAISGLPPLNGFVGEWLLYLGLLDAIASREPSAWATILAAVALAMSGALALATFVKAGAVVFLGAPRTQAARAAHECGAWMRRPMIALALVCVAIGLGPVLLWPAVAHAVSAWNPAFSAAQPPVPWLALGWVHVTLAVLTLGAAVGLWLPARRQGMRRSVTWDCGYAQPGVRMQYTSGSFAAVAAVWFAWILQPERRSRRPRGPWPDAARRLERVPETVLEHVLVPGATAVLHVSTAVRRLQHGRLQFYILYLALGLAALALLVFLGRHP
jgi:hydrogenase-4 component B